jgi:hypothetical protein
MVDYLKYKWLWIILMIVLGPFSFLILGFVFNCYQDEKWYSKWWIWVIAVIFVFPAIAMFLYLIADLISKTTFYLKTPLNQLFKYPFIWGVSFIPNIGFYLFVFLYAFLFFTISFKMIVSREGDDIE